MRSWSTACEGLVWKGLKIEMLRLDSVAHLIDLTSKGYQAHLPFFFPLLIARLSSALYQSLN